MSSSNFPVIKLFSLFIKTLSKPMANYLKRKSKENYWLRTYFCMPPAQCKSQQSCSVSQLQVDC